MSQKLLNCIRTLSPTLLTRRHPIFVTQKANKLIIYEHHRKGEYDTEVETTTKEKLKKGYEIIKQGIPEFKDEMKEFLEADLFFCASHGDYEYFAKFNGTKSLNNWVVTTDSDFRHGRSKAAFDITANNKAVFHGHLDPWVPKDGRQKKSGYINLRSPFNYKSFQRKIPYDWTRYTHLYIRLRGDGRAYQLNISPDHYFDVTWHDVFIFPLYTRGGPYWQIVKIPFSKFFLSAAGRIQDKQESLENNLDRIRNISITLADEVEGPFKLELDYIALIRDENHTEEFAYEMYQEHWSQLG